MSLKSFVNNHKEYSAFLEELDEWIAQEHRAMEQFESEDMWRQSQGAVKVLRRLKKLREKVNGKS